MPLLADPPHLSVCPLCHHLRCQVSVQGRMPFGGYVRHCCCKIIITDQHLLVRAIRASAPKENAVSYRRLILMPYVALPPYFFIAYRRHHLGREVTVLRRMPFSSDRRIQGCKICLSGNGALPRTVRTTMAVRYAICYPRLPRVTALTPPRHLPWRVRAHLRRIQRRVFLAIPLFEQVFLALSTATGL